MNGREATEAAPILDALPDLEQYIFCSSAGVYLKVCASACHLCAVKLIALKHAAVGSCHAHSKHGACMLTRLAPCFPRQSDQMPHREEDAGDPKSRHKVRYRCKPWSAARLLVQKQSD